MVTAAVWIAVVSTFPMTSVMLATMSALAMPSVMLATVPALAMSAIVLAAMPALAVMLGEGRSCDKEPKSGHHKAQVRSAREMSQGFLLAKATKGRSVSRAALFSFTLSSLSNHT